MANSMITNSDTLAKIALEVAEQLVLRRLEKKTPSKTYEKIDFNILEQRHYFSIQITKCSKDCNNLKSLLTFVLKPYLVTHKVNSNTVVAIVQKKLKNDILVQKIIYSKKRLTLVDDLDSLDYQRQLSSAKYYTAIKILFQVVHASLTAFYDIMLAYIMQIESYDPNIKFVFRKGSEHIYRNQVRMDNMVLSCKIFSSACSKIIQNSKDENFRRDMTQLLGANKPSAIEAALGCKLISQANNQFNVPSKDAKRKRKSL